MVQRQITANRPLLWSKPSVPRSRNTSPILVRRTGSQKSSKGEGMGNDSEVKKQAGTERESETHWKKMDKEVLGEMDRCCKLFTPYPITLCNPFKVMSVHLACGLYRPEGRKWRGKEDRSEITSPLGYYSLLTSF